MAKLFTNNGGLDQTLHSSASDLGLLYLPITLFGVSRLKLVKSPMNLTNIMKLN